MQSKNQRDASHEGPQTAFSSPPCYAHEVDPAYLGLEPPPDVAGLQALQSTLNAAIAALRSLRFP